MLRVVTPTLGKSPFLKATVDSVYRLGSLCEHVLVSPMSKVAILRNEYPHVTVIPDAGTQAGMYGAIEIGRTAPGSFDWFTYINDDDLLFDHFSVYLNEAASCGPHVRYGRVDLIDGYGAFISEITRCRSASYMLGLSASGRSPFNQQGTLISSAVFSKIGGFNAKYRYAADFDLFARCIVSGIHIEGSDILVAGFRCHEAQLSLQSKQFDAEIDEILAKYFDKVSILERKWGTLRFFWDNRSVYLARVRRGKKMGGRGVMRVSSD